MPGYLKIQSSSPCETMTSGEALSHALLLQSKSHKKGLILLLGTLGAGKTTFVKGFAKELGIDPQEITSPTFSLANVHKGKNNLILNHLDLYRLGEDGDPDSSLKEFYEAGLDEYLQKGISLIEWPDKLPENYLDKDSFKVYIDHFPASDTDKLNLRLITIEIMFAKDILQNVFIKKGLTLLED
jgi:tRNA threonylcarbamoyladenosine biosynthesis protein TsaE